MEISSEILIYQHILFDNFVSYITCDAVTKSVTNKHFVSLSVKINFFIRLKFSIVFYCKKEKILILIFMRLFNILPQKQKVTFQLDSPLIEIRGHYFTRSLIQSLIIKLLYLNKIQL